MTEFRFKTRRPRRNPWPPPNERQGMTLAKGNMSETSLTVLPRESTDIELGTLRADTPAALIAGATAIASPLAKLIGDRNLYTRIQGRDYVRCEGWTTMGAMLGVIPQEVSNVCDENGVYVATVELVNIKTGAIVGRASAECGNPDEIGKDGKPLWASRAAYARRSMAATRATGKAFRLSFSWIMALAGYEPTPAEEMDDLSENPAARAVAPQWPARGVAAPHSAPPPDAPVWTGKLVNMTTKEGTNKSGPWTLYTFHGSDGQKFGSFSKTIADGLMALDGHFVEITYSKTERGNMTIEEYSDANQSGVPL